MDFILIFDAVFADVSPTDGRKTPILNFTLEYHPGDADDCLGRGRERVEVNRTPLLSNDTRGHGIEGTLWSKE